jgi:hypothetical protein
VVGFRCDWALAVKIPPHIRTAANMILRFIESLSGFPPRRPTSAPRQAFRGAARY